jgi:acyl-coenzyme A thioesterase PaaI-like protein
MRDLLDTVVRSGASAAELAAVADAVAALTAQLSGPPPRRPQQDNPFHPMSLVGGTAHPVGPQVAFHTIDDGVRGALELGARFEGGPGLAHGGILALILDHAMGAAVYVGGHVAMTRTLDVHYLAPTPLDTPLEVTARVERVDGRKVHVRGDIVCAGRTTVSADGVFVRLTADNVTRIFADHFTDGV